MRAPPYFLLVDCTINSLRTVRAADNLYYLGILKLYGITLSRDVKGAGHYFAKAANLGHADSQTALGMMKLKGAGVEVDTVGAMNLFRRAVEQGNANGYWLLGK